jgi:hypothetical protein
MAKSLISFRANSSLNQSQRILLMKRRIALESIFISAKGLDHLPFFADSALPSGVFGPVERSQGRHRWIATA